MIYNILFGLVILLFLFFGLAWFISTKIIKQPRAILKHEWEKYALWPQFVDFESSDRLRLTGVYIKGSREATIILLHGYGRSKEQLLPQANFLNKAGYNIFMFDFRASGESEGRYITFGRKEVRDLVGAVKYLKKRSDVDMSKVGLLGFSMGGAVALMKSGDLPEIKAIAVSSSYAQFKTVIWCNFQQYLRGIPFFPIGYFTLWIIKYRTGCYLPTIAPVKYVHKLKARPLMIMHSAHDNRVPIEDAMEFYRKAPWLKEFWLVRNANHDDVYTITKDQYEEKILAFFNKYLLENSKS